MLTWRAISHLFHYSCYSNCFWVINVYFVNSNYSMLLGYGDFWFYKILAPLGRGYPMQKARAKHFMIIAP